jgi:tRNA (guanine37-N1)-methyltransferase
MNFEVVTLFPDIIRAYVATGMVGRAVERGLIAVGTSDPRDYALDVHRTVDDRPYGGGPGMVLKMEPLRTALRAAAGRAPAGSPRVYLSAQGRRFTQEDARRWSTAPGLVLLAGRYEGVDQRLLETEIDDEVSIGDYVLTGGELPALVVLDSVTRLLPGALGDAESAVQESFSDGLLDWPHYTRPEVFEGRAVPEVLLGGHHATIRRWRLQQALLLTAQRRPDLLVGRGLTAEERRLLAEAGIEAGLDVPVRRL